MAASDQLKDFTVIVRDLRSKYDARGMALAELDRKLESYKEEIANLCVDKASLTDRLASATRRIAELEQQQKPAPAEDRRCGTCRHESLRIDWEPCDSCRTGFSNWQKR